MPRPAQFTRALLLGLVVGASCMFAPGSVAQAGSLSPIGDEMRRVAAGEIVTTYQAVPGKKSSVYRTVGTVNGTIEQLYRYYTDPANTPRYQDTVRKQHVLKNTPTVKIVDYTLGLPWPLGERTVRLQFACDHKAHRIAWHRLQGNVREHRGFVVLKPLAPRRTLVTYQLEVDFDTFIPPALMSWATSKILPTVVKAARRDIH